jgi:hypothetical protein
VNIDDVISRIERGGCERVDTTSQPERFATGANEK